MSFSFYNMPHVIFLRKSIALFADNNTVHGKMLIDGLAVKRDGRQSLAYIWDGSCSALSPKSINHGSMQSSAAGYCKFDLQFENERPFISGHSSVG